MILEKLPLLAIAAAVSIATVIAQEPALEAATYLTLPWRIENALVTIWIYLQQMFWPFAPRDFLSASQGSLPLWEVALASGIAASSPWRRYLLGRKSYPYLLTGWLWYLAMLLPVIGLVQVGWQAHADRYTYLPQIGLSDHRLPGEWPT